MTFQEIFKRPGKYKGTDFKKGYVFVVKHINPQQTALTAEYFDDSLKLHHIDVSVTSDCFTDNYIKVH